MDKIQICNFSESNFEQINKNVSYKKFHMVSCSKKKYFKHLKSLTTLQNEVVVSSFRAFVINYNYSRSPNSCW